MVGVLIRLVAATIVPGASEPSAKIDIQAKNAILNFRLDLPFDIWITCQGRKPRTRDPISSCSPTALAACGDVAAVGGEIGGSGGFSRSNMSSAMYWPIARAIFCQTLKTTAKPPTTSA